MAAAATSLSAEAQKELLLAMGLPFESWKADSPLGDFEGVTVAEDGLIIGLNFEGGQDQEGKNDAEFNLADFAPLASLKEINLSGCGGATGGCVERGVLHACVWAAKAVTKY